MQVQSRNSSSLFNKLSSTMNPASQKFLNQAVANPNQAKQPQNGQAVSTAKTSNNVANNTVSSNDDLALLEQAVAEAEKKAAQKQNQAINPQPAPPVSANMVGQAIPAIAAQQTPADLNPPAVSRGFKESEAVTNPDLAAIEAGGPIQQVENKELGEISPEVSDFVKRVENQQNQQPQEIVIADGSQPMQPQKYPSKPVVVIPITPDIEKKGKRKNPKFSIRWLVEWSRKIIKAFKGAVIYRKVEERAE